MATTSAHSTNVVSQWDSKFYAEYVRDNLFKPYMGTSMNSVIQVKENLTKKKGDNITVSLVRKLSGDGVTGNTTLKGNEEALVNYGHAINVDVLRNAVLVTEWEEQKTEIGLRMAAKDALKNWAMDKMRDDLIAAMQSPVVDGVTIYSAATEDQKDAWLTANNDRVLFGDTLNNQTAGDHSASMDVIASTETLDVGQVSLAKRMAKSASNGAIRPVRVNGGEEWFVLFANPQSFRDLKGDTTLTAANREAWMRGKSNPLFRDGDLLWDGVIIREIPEIGSLGAIGADSAVVGANFFCGAQALGVAWAQRTQSRTDVDDYGFEHGVAVQEMRGIEKLMFNSVQHGMVTIYSAAAADT